MCPIYRFGNSMICYNNGKRATTKCKIKVHALQNFNPSNIKNSKHRVAQTIRTYACSICTLDCELSLFLPLQATRKKKFNSIEKGIWTLLKKVSELYWKRYHTKKFPHRVTLIDELITSWWKASQSTILPCYRWWFARPTPQPTNHQKEIIINVDQ